MTEDDRDAERSEEIPLSELRRRLEERRGRSNGDAGDERAPGSATDAPLSDPTSDARGRTAADPAAEGPFEAVDVETVDGGALWDAIVDGTAEPSEPAPDAAVDAGGGAESDAEERVVDKRELCQRCRFFSAPPAVACEREGTEIVEAVDGDRFRVRGCPMVDDGDGGWRSKLVDE